MTTSLIVPPWAQPTSCYSLLTTPPVEEPITVDEAKLRAGLDWPDTDPREALVPKYIAAARAMVERETGLALLTQERDVYFRSDTPYPEVMPLPSQSTPLQAITEVVPFDPATGWPTPALPPSHWFVRGMSLGVSGVPLGYGVRVHLIAGWPDVPALEGDAPLLVQAVGLLTAHYLTLGRDLAITGAVAAISSVPEGYEACIASYRLVWVA